MGTVRHTISASSFAVAVAVAVLLLLPGCKGRSPAADEASAEDGLAETVPAAAPIAAPAAPTADAPAAAPAVAPATPAAKPACDPIGSWDERWQGAAASDGKRLSGRSKETITASPSGLVGTGVDFFGAGQRWSGEVKAGDGKMRFEFEAKDKSYRGRYDCQFQADSCDTLTCSMTTFNPDGKANMRGTSTWTRAR